MKKLIIILFILLVLIIPGCSLTNVDADTQKIDNGRFDIIYLQYVKGIEISIILDKKTNVKYLQTVEGGTNGVGVGLCKLEELK
jgi:hypothetical protein